MGLYLSPYIGNGTKGDPFHPRGLRTPGASAIDLRPDCTCSDGQGIGYAVLWSPPGIPAPVGAIKLADDYGDVLSLPQRKRLSNLLRLDFSADRTIQDAVETVLMHQRGQYGGLRAARGRVEAWLGSGRGKRRWVDLPVMAGGSISDNFNRANESPVASPWTALSGSTGAVNLASNAITHAAQGDCFLYYNNAGGWNADQSAQWFYASVITNSDWGPAVRIGSSGFSGYVFGQFGGGGREIFKIVGGSYTSVEAASGNSVAGTTTVKIDIAGSTITYSDNGTPNANSPATDTSLATAGNGPGVFFFESGGSVDDAVLTGEITGGGGGGAAKMLMLLGAGGMVRLSAMARLKEPMNRRTLAKLLGVLLGGKK